MEHITQPQLLWLLEWIRTYPAFTGVMIFLIAMLESLVVVGMMVPGAIMMIGVGALIAFDVLNLWTSLAWAIAGAVAGDGFSFWLGHHYQDRLRRVWPFSRHPETLHRGEEFFLRHGIKSIVFGRFVGPVRAIIPTIAGMMGMRPAKFAIVNVLSAIAWAPAYILPGMVFGASIELAMDVAVRLVILLLLLIAFILLTRWITRHVYNLFQPRTEKLARASLHWARNHPVLGRTVMAFVDPRHPESPALLLYFVLLIAAGVLLFFLMLRVGGATTLGIDPFVHDLMMGLRSPWADAVMISITMLADPVMIVVYGVLISAYLLWQKNIPAAIHWIAILVFGAILNHVLKISLHVPRPDSELFAAPAGFSFPSTHSTMATLMFGFLSVIITRELKEPRHHMMVYLTSVTIISLVAFSRLYLGVHWFSDVLAGLLLGLVWVTLVGIAYRRHPSPHMPGTGLVIYSSAAMLTGFLIYHSITHSQESARYRVVLQEKDMPYSQWQKQEWQTLPAFRNDLINRHNQPFNLQWAGSLDQLKEHLILKGWKTANGITLTKTLRWLSPGNSIESFPVLPQVHNGRHERMTLVFPDTDKKTHTVLRLWHSGIRLMPQKLPLWLGIVSQQKLETSVKLFTFPITTHEFQLPLVKLHGDLKGLNIMDVKRDAHVIPKNIHWDGSVLLVSQ